MKWAIANKLAAGFGIVLAFVAANTIVSYRKTIELIESERWVSHTHEVLTQTESTLSILNNAEAGQRGYLITGNRDYLEPYFATRSQIDRHIKHLQELTADNPNQQRRISALQQKITARLNLLDRAIDSRKEQGFETAQQVVLSGKGKQVMDEIRKLIGEMENTERELLQQRSQQARANSQMAIATISLAALVNLALLALLYYFINRDIHQCQQAQEKQQESEQRFRATFEQAAVGIAHVAPDGKWLQVNHKLCDIVGYSREELLNLTFQDITYPDDLDTDLEYVRQMLASQIQTYSMEKRYIKKDGNWVWINLTVSLVRHSSGEPKYFIGVIEDISKRKQAEQELQNSENRLRAMLNAEPECVKLVAQDGTLLEMNSAGLVAIEVENAQQAIGKSVYPLIVPEYKEAFQALNESVCQGNKGTLEFEIISCKGNRRWMDTHAVPLYNQADGTFLHLAVTRDITGRKQAEQALQQSLKQLADLKFALDRSSIVAITNCKGTITYVNDNFCEISQYSREEVLGQNHRIINSGYHPLNFFQEMWATIASGQVWRGEIKNHAKDGTFYWVDTTIVPLLDALEKPFEYVAICSDITERKLAQEQIREQAQLLDKSQDAIFVLDMADRISFWNSSAENLFGWTAKEAIAANAEELLFEDSPQLQEVKAAITKSGEWQGELYQFTKFGKEIAIESRWTLVRDDKEQPKSILIINTEITEKKKLEAQLLRAQRLESIGTLAGGIAHDLNNVLAPILMSVQLLQNKYPNEKEQRLLALLETNVKRGANLIKQVLSFARGLEGQRTTVQIRHLIREIGQIIHETFPKSIELYTDISSSLWTISGDATQLHQVLMNLVVNARDAMPDGGRLSIFAENIVIDEHYAQMNIDAQAGSYIAITVTDTGTGMPPEVQERIFEPFFTTKELGKGTGLGLSTVIGIVKSHGGFVNLYTELGKGTRFKVYLPAVEGTETPQLASEELLTGKGELILVVDDEVVIREITKSSLEAYNYRVLTASDGVEALSLYAQHQQKISIILMDMMMPSMDGAITIRTLQKMNSQVKIIAISGLESNQQIAQAAGVGVKAFLPKPCTAKELLQAINSVKQS